MLRLFAQQSLTMQVRQEAISLQHYLKQPQRLVYALINPAQVEMLGTHTFRFYLKGIRFLMLSIQPVVDLRVDMQQPDLLTVRSVRCQFLGNELIDQRCHLSLTGWLKLQDQSSVTQLTGQVDLAIAVEVPPVLQFTPQSLLETTGNQILRSSLLTMKQRLLRQLVADYSHWSRAQAPVVAAVRSFPLAQQSSQAS